MIIRIIPLMFVGSILSFCGGSSPEAKLMELAPKFQKAMCSKTIECTKDEMAKIPAEYKNMVPAFMQSEENCVAFFKTKFEESEKSRAESKKPVTEEMVSAMETCINSLEATSCDIFQNSKEKVTIPGCEKMESLTPTN
jgi:hypothetical protein